MELKEKLFKEEESNIITILNSIQTTDKKISIEDTDGSKIKSIIIEDVYKVRLLESDGKNWLEINDIKSDDKTLFMSSALLKYLIKKYNNIYNKLCSEENKNEGLEEFFSYMINEINSDEYRKCIKESIGDINNLEKITSTEYPNSIFWCKDGKIILQYDKKLEHFWAEYYTIWEKFTKGYKLDFVDECKILSSILGELFK